MSNDASEVVGGDPQMGIVRVLRPYDTYQDVYEGQPVTTTAINLTEGGVALDEQAEAEEAGYDPRLVKGLATPLGAKCLVWLPNIAWLGDDQEFRRYVYSFCWRMRNTYDFRQRFRRPYHFPKQIDGVAETDVFPGARVVIPAAVPSVVYIQPEGAAFAVQTQNLHQENYRHGGAPLPVNILNPDGAVGAIQQGIQVSGAGSAHLRPTYTCHEMICAGDELIVLVNRENPEGAVEPNWEFAGADAAFAAHFDDATPDIGVYVLVGSTP